ncbi:MAG: sulfite exporter TauE/SafE family protein [Alphaproteobacteria bacterium]|nr:MAG: sulfite exporter TauE/SafE family protein [Alphaproteobacteria bacterium]
MLLAASFAGSFITAALGIGGGALLLAAMASLMPPAALIPVHGVVQLGSNALRAAVLWRHVHWPPLAAFALGTLAGVALGGTVVVRLPGPVVQAGVGAFVIWSVLARPPAWLARRPAITGVVSAFLTMFFGATGVFVANFTKSLRLPRRAHVATHAVLMTFQHGLKIVAFGFLGFAYGPWAGFILAMIAAGFLGTMAGRHVLFRISDRGFRRALDAVLILVSLRLIWNALAAWLWPEAQL